MRAYPAETAALLAVELCSLTFQRAGVSTVNQISASLFGDGASAVVVAGREVPAEGPRIVSTRSVFYRDTEDVMGWNISERGFRIVLTRGVPEIVKRHLADDVDAFLAGEGLDRKDIGSWIIHPGGRGCSRPCRPRSIRLPARSTPPGAVFGRSATRRPSPCSSCSRTC